MTKFIEVEFNGKTNAINIDNIAIITRVDQYTTEFQLLSKDDNNLPMKFQVRKNYADFKLVLNNQDRLAFDFTIHEHR